MYGLRVFLVLLLPLSAQITPVFLKEVSFSPTATEEPLDRATGSPLSGFLSPSASPSIEPSEEDEWALVEAYLHSGNATLLAQANCSRAYRVPGLQGVPLGLLPILRPALDALTNAANFLNMIFQANDLRESSVTEDMEWYHALVRGLLEGDPLIRQALLTFDAQPAALRPQLVLRASRPSSKPQDILLQDLSSAWELMHPPPPAPDASWFTALKFPEMPQHAPPLSKRVLLNDLRTLGTPKWGRGDSYVTNQDGVRWADAPFLECEGGRFAPGWLLTLSTSFYGLKPDLSPEFRGVIRVDVSIQSFDVDQCAKGKDWFSNTHQCNRTSMQCEPINGQGFRMGQYCCRCKEGYYNLAKATQDTSIAGGSTGNTSGLCSPALPVCLSCWPGCLRCEDASPCRVQEDWYLRAGMLAVQGFFMLLVFISMLVAYQFRRSKRIRASGLLLLETILFGSLLLYFPVFILYFKPSTFRCILLRWVRLLGFAIVYGTVTLKMYRVLKVFLSRTAQRVPYMSSAHLLRMLGVIVMTVSWFLSAWTAGVLQNRDRNVPLLISSTTSEGQGFSLCDLDRWDYMMAIAEVLFLCWGSFLCNAVRTVPSAFHEPRYMGIAIHNELLFSATFHLLRFAVPSLHPDWMLLLFFTHTHVTVTVTLGLLFIPKFLHVSKPRREDIAAEVYEDEVDLRRSGSYFNSSFASAWSDHSLDPDDIRDELKKLYVQLEIHKTKKMTANNPHLQKKRISRRSLGRSIMRRITEIPETMGRQCSREDKEGPVAVGGGSQSGLSKKNVMESSSIKSKDESLQHCVLSIRKSHSTNDYVGDPQSHPSDTKNPSMLDSLMKMKLARKASVHSDTDSVDAAPLVYKSASAQNLSAERKVQPEPNKLQKSLSVMTRNKVLSTLHPSKTCSLEDTSQAGSASLWKIDPSRCNATIRTQTTQALLSGSFDMEEVCPWELENHLPERKSQKHVTYALSQDSDQRTPENLQLLSSQQNLISPWNTLLTDQSRDNCTLSGKDMLSKDERRKDVPHRNGNEGSDSDTESKPQVPVSSSAPGSPVTVKKRPKEHRVFSYRGPPHSFSLSVKGLVRSAKGSENDKNKKSSNVKEKKKEPLGSKCLEKEKVSPISPRAGSLKVENVHMKSDSKEEVHILIPNISALHKQQRSKANASPWVVDSTKPCLVKEDAIRMSPVRNTKKQDSILGDGCSWQTENIKKRTTDRENTYGNICPWETLESEEMTSQNSSHANICSREMKEEPPSIEHHNMSKRPEPTVAATIRNTDNQNVSVQMSVNAEICPWDTTEPPQQKTQRQQSICSWDMKEINPSSVKKDTVKSASVGLKDIVAILRQRSVQANICPWEIEEPRITVKRQESDRINICPWESDEPEKAISQHGSVYANICPWETQEQTPTQGRKEKEEKNTNTTAISTAKKSKERNSSPQTDVKAEVCPWDVSDPCQQPPKRQQSNVEDVCPWDVEYEENTTEKQERLHTDIFLSNSQGHKKSATTEESDISNICPWETQDDCLSKDSQEKVKYSPKPTITTTTKKHLDGKVPSLIKVKAKLWSLEILGSSQSAPKTQQSSVSEVCPWDVEKLTDTPKRQESFHAGISHSETQENPSCAGSPNEVVYSKHSLITNLERSGDRIQTSVKAEVCPWDIPAPCQPTTLKQKSSLADVDHWDVEVGNLCQEKVTSTLEGVNDSEKTKQKLESVRANICPWEMEEPETTKRQESIRSDICPWEAQDTLGLEGPGRDIKCKELLDTSQQSRSTGTSKQSSITEVCPPSELVLPEAPPNMADICPWETESIKPCLVKQAAIRLSSEEAEALEATSKTTFVDMADKIMRKQDSVRADVCPWEMEEPEKSIKKHENNPADICPWENQSAEKIKAENSTLAEVCPWETDEPEKTINQESIHSEVCPWETEVEPKPAIVKTAKQSSVGKITTDTTNRGKICQQEMEMPDMAAVDETDTKVSESSKIEGDSNEPIVSGLGEAEGTKPNLPLGRRDALCPWEMQEVKPPLVEKEVSNTDISPWECEDLAVDNDAESAAEAFFFPADL